MMKYNYGRRQSPFSIRLSFDERAALEKAAGGMPVAAYIKSLILGRDLPAIRTRGRAPAKDHKALAELLACLGASRIANNLNQLARAANSGSHYFDRETKAQLNAACQDIRVMRQLLMQGLGMKFEGEAATPQSTSQSFARAVGPEPRP